MMYRILIVDDEHAIAEGIRYMLVKGLPECEVAGIADDGTTGYTHAMELQPDIVLTDVRMIEMDGFEMITRLKAAGFQGRFVILSGYSDFEYAKRAISLGVEDYIIKPIEEEELYDVLLKVCASIQEEYDKKKTVQSLEDTVESYGQSIKEYVLKEILNSPVQLGEMDRVRLRQLGFPVAWRQYYCILLEISEESTEEQIKLFFDFLEKKLETFDNQEEKKELIRFSDRQAVVVNCLKKSTTQRKIVTDAGIIRFEAEEMTGIAVSAGIGLIYPDMGAIYNSFEEARSALNYKVMKGLSSTISYEDIKNMTGYPVQIEEEDMKRLEDCMDRMDDAGCGEVVEIIFRKISKDNNSSLKDLQVMSLSLSLLGIRKMPFMQQQINEYLGSNILSLESISKFTTAGQLKNWIINILKGMNELMLHHIAPEKSDIIEDAKEYFTKNFSEDISLTNIAERFHINPYYFSQLFKKKTGTTYRSYLTEIRIDRAKKLLKETELRVYEVCYMVGYADTSHFSKVFERMVGVKPSEYRNGS